jgi:hypothetical protein
MTIRRCGLGVLGFALLLCGSGCNRNLPGSEIGSTYARLARPAVWRVVPGTQAESVGLAPGDLIVSYNGEPVATVDDLWQLQDRAVRAGGAVSLGVLRDEQQFEVAVHSGALGILPEQARYTSSLAVALEDILASRGSVADYDWLAAATGESFTLSAIAQDCPMNWSGALADECLDSLRAVFGLSFNAVFVAEPVQDTTNRQLTPDTTPSRPQLAAVQSVRTELERGRTILLLGEWADGRVGAWGVVTRFDAGDSLLYGYTVGSAAEVPVTGEIDEAFDVRYSSAADVDPDELLRYVLNRAVELGQAYSESDVQSGIAAYDVWLAALDSVPFCRDCGGSSQACFDAVVWGLAANRQSANDFLADMRDVFGDQGELIDEIRTNNTAILARVGGLVRSGLTVGTAESQAKLARAVAEIQRIDIDQQALYQELLRDLQ